MLNSILENFTEKITRKISALERRDYVSGSFSRHRVVIVSLTTRCNFSCPHCLRREIDGEKSFFVDLPINIFEETIRGAAKIGFQIISFTGGEPILHPQFKNFATLAQKYGYRFNFVTNGWLHKEYWEAIRSYREGLEAVFLSLDGVTPEMHDSVRNKPGSFGRLMESIRFYKKHSLPLAAIFCVTKRNMFQIESIPKFCSDLGIHTVKWVTVMPVYGEFDNAIQKSMLDDAERAEAFSRIMKAQEKFKLPKFFITKSFYPVAQDCGVEDAAWCRMFDGYTLYLDHDGGMFFCCDINRHCRNKPLVKNLGFEKSFRITVDAANEMKKKFLSNKRKIGRFCDFCNRNINDCLDSATERG